MSRSRPRTSRRPSTAPPAPEAPPAAPPPFPRDPWLWLSALSVLPLVLHSLGAPLGEPVAEDFDFLRHNLLLGKTSLLDGGGSQAFWRPVSHQLYYRLLGGLILTHPAWVAALHALLLAASAALLYRALRPAWSGPRAAAAASFPFLMESARTVISWPSHGVELASLLFTTLALHEASRRRLATCLGALLLALLSKEVAVVAALLLPLWPGLSNAPDAAARRRERMRWGAATGGLVLAWALAYLMVRQAEHLALPHRLESVMLAVSPAVSMVWASVNSLRAVASLPAVPTPADFGWAVATIVLLVFAGVRLGRTRAAARGNDVVWTLWGLAWFALASATLTTIYPIWAPNRALFGSVGLGIALAALLGSAHRHLPWALAVLRLVMFASSPGPARFVAVEAAPTGAFMDFEQLTRLQRLMREMRQSLTARYRAMPRGAVVGQHAMPRSAEYAFGGDFALQVWYRDTTLRLVRFETYSRDPSIPLATIAEYQPGYAPGVALVEPDAMRAMLNGVGRMSEQRLMEALELFHHAEAVQRDTAARVFLGTVAGKRAICEMDLGRREAAEAEARRAIRIYREGADGRYVVARLEFDRGALEAAAAQLDTLLVVSPGDRDAVALRERIRAGGR